MSTDAMKELSRRDVLHTLSTAAAVSAPFQVSRADAQVTPEILRFSAEIEPLVTLIERSPRDKCAEVIVEQFRRGVSYRQALAALFLAGVRNVNPRPPGFALHSVFIIHSAHLLSLEAPAGDRLLPFFYALDAFKASQERDARQPSGDYTMRPLTRGLPSPDRAAAEFAAAMEAWDGERAERAIAVLARYRSPAAVSALLWPLGVRDYRNIGHKAIYVANASRTLDTIGWQYAEPVFRSIALSLTDFGKEQTINGYAFEDQCYLGNVKRVTQLTPKLGNDWESKQGDTAQTRSIVETMSKAAPDEACTAVAARMMKGATARTVWDAVHLAAADLRVRANAGAAILAVHAVTSANALHYSYLAATDPNARLLILLQAAGWMTQFRSFAETREDNLRSQSILSLERGEMAAAQEIFAAIPANPDRAASQVFALAQDPALRPAFLSAAVRSTAAKADEVHYYKYLAALIEDVSLVSPEWQPHLLATSAYYLKGSKDPESAPVRRARELIRPAAG